MKTFLVRFVELEPGLPTDIEMSYEDYAHYILGREPTKDEMKLFEYLVHDRDLRAFIEDYEDKEKLTEWIKEHFDFTPIYEPREKGGVA